MSNNLLSGYPDFTGWSTSSSTLTNDVAGDPFGGALAARVTEITNNAVHAISLNTTILANRPYFLGCFSKQGSGSARNAVLQLSDTGFSAITAVTFDNATGAVDVSGGNVLATSTGSSPAGNGWWWFWFCTNLGGGLTSASAAIQLATGTTNSYLGDGTSNILTYGAVLGLADDLMGQSWT